MEPTLNTPHDGIRGKVVIVTGASSGLGEATARHLAARGARLVLAARRTERLQALASELQARGAEVLVQATDVSNAAQVQALADAAVARFGRIDVLVNNAGIMPLAPLARLEIDEWSRMLDVNVRIGAHRKFKHPLPRPHRHRYRAAMDLRRTRGTSIRLDLGESPAWLSCAPRSGPVPGTHMWPPIQGSP